MLDNSQPPQRIIIATSIGESTGVTPGEIVAGGWDLEQNRPVVFIKVDYNINELQHVVALNGWQSPPPNSEYVLTWSGIIPTMVPGGVVPSDIVFHVWRIPDLKTRISNG